MTDEMNGDEPTLEGLTPDPVSGSEAGTESDQAAAQATNPSDTAAAASGSRGNFGEPTSGAYAVICDGGRQYRITEGMVLDIDFREGLDSGAELTFDRVLALSDGKSFQLGQPILESVQVTATVIGEAKGIKLVIQKFRRRKNSRRRTGHRQKYTRIEFGKLPQA